MSVKNISYMRQSFDSAIQFLNGILDECNKEGSGREMALVKTKLQEARMWAGQALSHYNTGFVPTDQVGKPETASKDLSATPEITSPATESASK